MFIHEAVREAMELGCDIVRSGDIRHLRITPSDSDEGLIVTAIDKAPCPRWQPRAEDLMADDWIITTETLQQLVPGTSAGI